MLKLQKKHWLGALIALVIVGAVAGAVSATGGEAKKPATTKVAATTGSCGVYRQDGIVTVNGVQLKVETAAGTKELVKGLSGRPCIPPNWGMLFDFGSTGQYAIWMKDMKFPIDVAWIDAAHKVVALEIDFQPSTYNNQQPEKSEKRANQAPARYVLEIGANQSKRLNMTIGTLIHFQKT